jgi:hypothetical protein
MSISRSAFDCPLFEGRTLPSPLEALAAANQRVRLTIAAAEILAKYPDLLDREPDLIKFIESVKYLKST